MGVVGNRYAYTDDLLHLESYRPPPRRGLFSRGPSPINLHLLSSFLCRHPDQVFASYIFRGLRDGFRIGFAHPSHTLVPATGNHPSSRERPRIISAHLQEELQLGRIVHSPPALLPPRVHTNPIGLVPKPHSDKWRLIVDLSSPRGLSVNDGISPALCSLQIRLSRQRCGYHQATRPWHGTGENRPFQCLSHGPRPPRRPVPARYLLAGRFIYRPRPTIRPQVCPKIFTAVADSLAWALFCEGVSPLIHYLDDFLFFGSPTSISAARARHVTESLFSQANVPIAHHKTEGPTTSLTFLGIEIDTVRLQLSLPGEKVRRLRELLRKWTHKRACTRRELESLVGHLCHAATVIRPGRIFLRHLFSLLSRVSNPSHFIRLNTEARTDIAWWQCLLQQWNGRSFFPPPDIPSCHVFSDASGSFGCGAICGESSAWFQLSWPDAWAAVGIAAKELVPIVVAAALWGAQWAGRHICFHSDNDAVVSIIQRRSAKHLLITHLLRCLFFYASVHQFHFSALHIPGTENVLADAISRNNLTLLSTFLPQVPPVVVPPGISQFLLHLPDWGSPSWTEQFVLSLR